MGPRKRCLDRPFKVTNGSQIHKLCMQGQALIQDNLYWISGNGKIIKLWEYRIMNKARLANVHELQDLRRLWMKNAGLVSLWDISIWKENIWLERRKPNLPSNLENSWLELRAKLKDKAPMHEKKNDQRSWGPHSGVYSVAHSYKLLRAIPYAPPCPALWKGLWKQKMNPQN
jgi:hypothetical protein